ncbi:MAG: PhzF family phenazine biosynthesis protein [Oligoflexia bacterium]|nr:PhzF family phenazine biosynthesis protein [Oligoflexia bacterium]
MKSKQFLVLNVFAEEPYGGNPAAVFPDAREIPEDQLQLIARQLNLIETVFAYPIGSAGIDYQLRYFTPLEELPVAGHPTIATWVALAKLGLIPVEDCSTFTQKTGAGNQQISISRIADTFLVSMNQPKPTFTEVLADREKIVQACGLKPQDLDGTLPVQGVSVGLGHIIVPVRDLKTLMNAKMNVAKLRRVCADFNMREAQLFTFEAFDPGMDLYTRNFTPREGLEDPACGNGNGALGVYLAETKYKKHSQFQLKAQQGHGVNMPSVINIAVARDIQGNPEVSIAGSALVMIKGEVVV